MVIKRKKKFINNPKVKTIKASRALKKSENTAVRLLRDINEHLLDPKELSKTQRKSVLCLMSDGSRTTNEIAAMFGVGAQTIRNDLREIREELGREVGTWSLDTVVGDLAIASESLYSKAMKAGDYALAWTIKKDLVKQLREMGVIGGVKDNSGLRITIEGMSGRYDNATKVLASQFSHAITGEVIDALDDIPSGSQIDSTASQGLSLPNRLLPLDTKEPDVEIVVPQDNPNELKEIQTNLETYKNK